MPGWPPSPNSACLPLEERTWLRSIPLEEAPGDHSEVPRREVHCCSSLSLCSFTYPLCPRILPGSCPFPFPHLHNKRKSA